MCKDTRFSCPSGFACKRKPSATKTAHNQTKTELVCTRGAATLATTQNINSVKARANPKGGLLKAPRDNDFCGIVSDYLPNFCACYPSGPVDGSVDCTVDMLDVDTIEFEGNFSVCSEPASVSVTVQEDDIGFSWSDGFSLGDDVQVPIPGLSVDIPYVGSAGVVLDVEFDGDISALSIDIGLDACADLPVVGKKCGSDITSELPIELIQQTFDFSDACGSGPGPGPTGQAHYDDPWNGCRSDEVNISATGIPGDWCAPSCTYNACPTDQPDGMSADPECALSDTQGNKYCALICDPNYDECGECAGPRCPGSPVRAD